MIFSRNLTIDAIRYDGNNEKEVLDFCGNPPKKGDLDSTILGDRALVTKIKPGDFITKDPVSGEVRVVLEAIFSLDYEVPSGPY